MPAYDSALGELMSQRRKAGKPAALEQAVDRIAGAVTHWAGSSWGFGVAAGTVLVWAISGPLFRWSDTWQLVINKVALTDTDGAAPPSSPS